MATPPALRLEGIYGQRQKGFFMQRVKLPAGLISSAQARVVAQTAQRYARGLIHLTVRESMELHWLTEADLVPVARQLASVGLLSRGACGGAVRGVTCGALGCAAAPRLEALARRIHRHFTGNPRFESLPKKFKVGLEADAASGRHLIQDVGILPAGENTYDVYVAGGLGREPIPGYLFAEGVPEGGLIPLIEAIATVYARHGAPGKRIKHLVAQIGREKLKELVYAEPEAGRELPVAISHFDTLVPLSASGAERVEAAVFAGELPAEALAKCADFADRFSGGLLTVTSDQNLAFFLEEGIPRAEAQEALRGIGFGGDSRDDVAFRVCPGNHECIMGLAPTRDVTAKMLQAMGERGGALSWAISGCPNSCAQPQLADVGIIAARLEQEGEARVPRYTVLRRGALPFAGEVRRDLTEAELLEAVRSMN